MEKIMQFRDLEIGQVVYPYLGKAIFRIEKKESRVIWLRKTNSCHTDFVSYHNGLYPFPPKTDMIVKRIKSARS